MDYNYGLSILSIGPASAVQIESINPVNINSTISDKNLDNNNTTLDNNTSILNGNNSTDTNQTITNGTVCNSTNGTAVLNETFSNNTIKKENSNSDKSNVIDTLKTIDVVLGTCTGIAFAATLCNDSMSCSSGVWSCSYIRFFGRH